MTRMNKTDPDEALSPPNSLLKLCPSGALTVSKTTLVSFDHGRQPRMQEKKKTNGATPDETFSTPHVASGATSTPNLGGTQPHDRTPTADDAKILTTKRPRRGPRGGVYNPFPMKLHLMLSSVEADGLSHVVSWQPHGRSFCVHQHKEFASEIMPKYFSQTKLASFQRQLNLYGFMRLTKGKEKGAYYHELFRRDKAPSYDQILRTKIKGNGRGGRRRNPSEPDFTKMDIVPKGRHVSSTGSVAVEKETKSSKLERPVGVDNKKCPEQPTRTTRATSHRAKRIAPTQDRSRSVKRHATEKLSTNPVATFCRKMDHIDLANAGTFKWLRGVKIPPEIMGDLTTYPRGCTLSLPTNCGAILKINPEKKEVSTFGSEYFPKGGAFPYSCGKLSTINGCVYAIPANASQVMKINPRDEAVDFIGPRYEGGAVKWFGAIVGVDGCIYGIPHNATGVLKINPTTDEVSVMRHGTSPGGQSKRDVGSKMDKRKEATIMASKECRVRCELCGVANFQTFVAAQAHEATCTSAQTW